MQLPAIAWGRNDMKPVTLKDVAAAAGVSISTVSRVLDERLPASKSPSAQRVREAAAALGYQRDTAASSLRRGDTGTVGVLVPRLSDTVMAMLFEAVFAEASRRGLFALVSVCGDDPDRELAAADALMGRRVDGIILAAARLEDTLPEHLRERDAAHVLAIRTNGTSPSSVCDDELGGYLATRHLIDLGHRRIGILPGPEFTSTAVGRLKGFHRAMDEAGLSVTTQAVLHGGFDFEAGRAAATALLTHAPRTTAIFAANDDLALGAMAAARAASLAVPEDVSIVGYNDTPLATRLPIPLTSVRVPFDHIAVGALDLLIAQTHGTPRADLVTRVAIPTLIPRASTIPHR